MFLPQIIYRRRLLISWLCFLLNVTVISHWIIEKDGVLVFFTVGVLSHKIRLLNDVVIKYTPLFRRSVFGETPYMRLLIASQSTVLICSLYFSLLD